LGRIVTKACAVGCIACKLCEKACSFDAIHVIDNLAVIDYSKCTSCGKCVAACPRKIIVQEQGTVKKEEKKIEAPVEQKSV
jgi:ferredoxin